MPHLITLKCQLLMFLDLLKDLHFFQNKLIVTSKYNPHKISVNFLYLHQQFEHFMKVIKFLKRKYPKYQRKLYFYQV